MKNLKDPRTKIYPSTTRGGKELPSSTALDAPSILSKLATPKPASAMICRMLLMMPLLLCMILMMRVLLCLILVGVRTGGSRVGGPELCV